MSYRNAALALQGVTDLTADWGTFGNLIQTRPDPGTEGFCYEFTLVRRSTVNVSTAVALAEAVAMGAAAAGYSWDVYGVLLSTGAAGFPVVQVIFQFSDWTIAGDLGAINVAVNDAVVKSGLGDGIGAVSMLRLTAPEARYFSQQGGLAPLVVTENKKVSLTKAAVSPSGKQVMSGDVRDLNAATPLSVLKQTVAAATAEAPWGLLLGAVLLTGGVLFLSGFLSPGMRPNKRRSGKKSKRGMSRWVRFGSKAEAKRYERAIRKLGLETRSVNTGHRRYPHEVCYRGSASAERKASALFHRSFAKLNQKYTRRRLSRNGSDDAQFALRLLKAKEKPGMRPNASKRRRRRGLRRKFFLGKEPGPLERHGRRLKGRGGVTTLSWEFANKSAADRFKKWADSKGFDGVVVRRTRLKGAPYVAVAVVPIHISGGGVEMLISAGYRMSKASYGLRANGSDDAQFALRLLKSKEKPGLLDTARYERGLQELMNAFSYYDQVTESALQDEPYRDVDSDKYRLGEAYDRYLEDERRDAMKKAMGGERSPWEF